MAKDKQRFSNNINVKNKRARYEYEFVDTHVAGIVLQGSEIKSIREGKINLQDGYCQFHNNELFVRNIHISQYEQGTHFNHEPTRERKLLMKRKELIKLKKKSEEKGLTIIPIRVFTIDRGLAKIEIALAKGKKIHDKRQDLKEKTLKRELREIKI